MGSKLLRLTTESLKSEMGIYAYLHGEAAGTHGNTHRQAHTRTKTYRDSNLSLSPGPEMKETNRDTFFLLYIPI